MDRYPRYLWMVVVYMAALVVAGTLLAMFVGRMPPVDAFYYVVQTLWTVGYGDVLPPGDTGRIISIVVMVFGTIGITSALGVVGGMVLDRHTKRHAKLEGHISQVRETNLDNLYRWAEEHGIDRETVDRTVREVRDEQR